MPRRATILIAGTLLATAIFPAVATSQSFQQSSVDNQQTQNGDLLSGQTLNVVTADQTTGTTSATANGYAAAVASGSLDVQSVQTANGNVTATTTLNVGNASGSTTLNTAATGNTGQVNSIGYGDLTGNGTQTTGPVTIDAESQINAANGQASQVNANVQAIANSQNIGAVGGSATMTVNQSSQAVVEANGGAVMGYSGAGQASFTSVASGNNAAFDGTNGATTNLAINQANTGAGPLQSAQFVAVGEGQSISGSANAIANNITVSNENNPLGLATSQTNDSYVRGQTEVSAFQFGAASASANGVGNSVTADNVGADFTFSNSQTNAGGGVEVLSSVSGTGGPGYDMSSSATAMGNAVTGFACSTCQSKINVINRQTNATNVAATSTVNMSSDNRTVTGVSTAVGNSATFYVSQPDD